MPLCHWQYRWQPYSFICGPELLLWYGISLTHGFPRQHIWIFAAGIDEQTTYPTATCPCVTGSTGGSRIPSFVGQNYFCETGVTQWPGINNGPFYSNGDPLWDGQGCGPTSSCCTFNSPPWFNVQLSSPTTDNVEVRICGNQGVQRTGSPIQIIELYVKWTDTANKLKNSLYHPPTRVVSSSY